QWIGRSNQHLRKKRIGIQRDGRNQRIELIGRYFWRCLLCRRGGRLCLGQRSYVSRYEQCSAQQSDAVLCDFPGKSESRDFRFHDRAFSLRFQLDQVTFITVSSQLAKPLATDSSSEAKETYKTLPP